MRKICTIFLFLLVSCVSYKSSNIRGYSNYENILKDRAIVFTKSKTFKKDVVIGNGFLWNAMFIGTFTPVLIAYSETRHYTFRNIDDKSDIWSYQYIFYRPPFEFIENAFFNEGYIGFIVNPGKYILNSLSIGFGAKIGAKILPLSIYNCYNFSFHKTKDLELTSWEEIKQFPPPSCSIIKVDEIYQPYFEVNAGEVLYIGDIHTKTIDQDDRIVDELNSKKIHFTSHDRPDYVFVKNDEGKFLEWFNGKFSETILKDKIKTSIMKIPKYDEEQSPNKPSFFVKKHDIKSKQ